MPSINLNKIEWGLNDGATDQLVFTSTDSTQTYRTILAPLETILGLEIMFESQEKTMYIHISRLRNRELYARFGCGIAISDTILPYLVFKVVPVEAWTHINGYPDSGFSNAEITVAWLKAFNEHS